MDSLSDSEQRYFSIINSIISGSGRDASVLIPGRTGSYFDIVVRRYNMLRFKLTGKVVYWLVREEYDRFPADMLHNFSISPPSSSETHSTRLHISSADVLFDYSSYIISRYDECVQMADEHDRWIADGKPMNSIITIDVSYDESGNVSVACTSSNDNHVTSNRAGKGKSVVDVFCDYVAIDIETTGLDPYYDSIIEIAAIRIVNGKPADTFQSFVNPGFELDNFITDLTGITDEMLAGAPPVAQVLPQFLSFIGDSILVGHNVAFDVNFLYDGVAGELNGVLPNDYLDTRRMWRSVEKGLPHYRLKDAVKRFSLSDAVHHRAASDAFLAHLLYERLLSLMDSSGIDISDIRTRKKTKLSASSVTSTVSEFDMNSPIYGKTFAFTGAMERMTRKEAMQMVVDAGGRNGDGVTKETNYLVLGNGGYCVSLSDGKSSKRKKAEKMKLDGFDIEIISENVFLDMFSE